MNTNNEFKHQSLETFKRVINFKLFAVLLFLSLTNGWAQTFSVLHYFSRDDEWGPWGKLVSSGTSLYGTTRYSTDHGTIFKVNTDGGDYAALHNFSLTDGSDPMGGLVLSDTTLYGTTETGGIAIDPGTVFTINTDGSGFTTLKDFAEGGGRYPCGDLVLSGTTLYGVTSIGGSYSYGDGTIFKVNTDGSGYSNLHDFTGYPNDGYGPCGGLTLSGTTLYGATGRGGCYGPPTGWPDAGYGTLFKINTDGSGYTILKQFTQTDGWAPYGGLALSGTTLYGITEGGYLANGNYGGGTVFKINIDGSGYTVLHRFVGPPSDGAVPYGGLTLSGTTVYGVTTAGGHYGYSPAAGEYGYGTIFKVNTDGSDYSLLKEFTGADGAMPYAGLLQNGSTLYGTTTSGGTDYNGVIFALSLPVPTILTPPLSQTAEIASSSLFYVEAEKDFSLIYQWFFNETNRLACTNSWLELTNLQSSQSGTYTVFITNAAGAVTSAPAMLNVIPAVERRPVPAINLNGNSGSMLNVDCANSLNPAPDWSPLDSVDLTNPSQFYYDLTQPLPPQRFYRSWQTGAPSVIPSLNLHMVPAITLTGNIGDTLRLDYINRFGPTDAWVTLDSVTLTNMSQLYFDVSSIGQPPRLWRIVPLP